MNQNLEQIERAYVALAREATEGLAAVGAERLNGKGR